MFGTDVANVLRTSEVLRLPVSGRAAGDRRSEGAVSEGASAGMDSGVSQNMYMKPSSSFAETGFASSARRRAVVCGEADLGIRERNSPVCEMGSRWIGGRWMLIF